MKYKVTIPFIPSMGSVTPMIVNETPMTSKEEDLLWHLNKMREHDGLKPWECLDDEVFLDSFLFTPLQEAV